MDKPEFATGDVAKEGTYICENCGKSYEHKKEGVPLPPCPHCKIWTLYHPETNLKIKSQKAKLQLKTQS